MVVVAKPPKPFLDQTLTPESDRPLWLVGAIQHRPLDGEYNRILYFLKIRKSLSKLRTVQDYRVEVNY
jgi:hypothetical protein